MNGHTLGFHPQTQNLEPSCTAQQTSPQESTAQPLSLGNDHTLGFIADLKVGTLLYCIVKSAVLELSVEWLWFDSPSFSSLVVPNNLLCIFQGDSDGEGDDDMDDDALSDWNLSELLLSFSVKSFYI